MKYLPFAVVLVVLAVGTLVEGYLSDRWGRKSSEKLDAFTARLLEVPKEFGDWKGVDDPTSDEEDEEFKASNCTGCISRTYTNREGQQVNMYLVSGTARHVTIHTPDWCYVGAGYVMEDEPQQYTLQDETMNPPPEFLTTRFLKEDPLQTQHLRIFWSFSENGTWLGPRMAKPAFAGLPALYKIYLITRLDGTSVPATIEGNPTLEFAKEFFPRLNEVLFKKGDEAL